MHSSLTNEYPIEPIKDAPPVVQEIIKKVLSLEHEHLMIDKPRVNEDIVSIIKQVVNDSGGDIQ